MRAVQFLGLSAPSCASRGPLPALQVKTALDYGHDNWLMTFLCGALNYQVRINRHRGTSTKRNWRWRSCVASKPAVRFPLPSLAYTPLPSLDLTDRAPPFPGRLAVPLPRRRAHRAGGLPGARHPLPLRTLLCRRLQLARALPLGHGAGGCRGAPRLGGVSAAAAIRAAPNSGSCVHQVRRVARTRTESLRGGATFSRDTGGWRLGWQCTARVVVVGLGCASESATSPASEAVTPGHGDAVTQTCCQWQNLKHHHIS